MLKKDREERFKVQKDKDVKAWLLIGAMFVGTLLVAWLSVVIAAMHTTHS
jgi:hypothetical protein